MHVQSSVQWSHLCTIQNKEKTWDGQCAGMQILHVHAGAGLCCASWWSCELAQGSVVRHDNWRRAQLGCWRRAQRAELLLAVLDDAAALEPTVPAEEEVAPDAVDALSAAEAERSARDCLRSIKTCTRSSSVN